MSDRALRSEAARTDVLTDGLERDRLVTVSSRERWNKAPFHDEGSEWRDLGEAASAWASPVRSRRRSLMAYSICEPCIGTKDTACVDVCPVDCIHPRKDEDEFEAETMLCIHPDECIDCGACIPACPVEAIFVNDEVPDQWQSFIETNANWFEGN